MGARKRIDKPTLLCYTETNNTKGGGNMRSFSKLPDGFVEIYSIDLKKNKKAALLVNALAIIIGVALAIIGHFIVPITTLFSMDSGITMYMLRYLVLVISLILYIILHELVHGIAMKICGTKKVKYGFTGLYAFAGSNDYYDKISYIFIALAPIVVWGIILAVINIFVPAEWFWIVYFIQLSNLSGAAGDLYVTVKFSKMPRDILIFDYGVGMKVFSNQQH